MASGLEQRDEESSDVRMDKVVEDMERVRAGRGRDADRAGVDSTFRGWGGNELELESQHQWGTEIQQESDSDARSQGREGGRRTGGRGEGQV